MDILITHAGQQSGPFSEEDLLAMVRDGEVQLSDMAWRPGMGDWLPLQQVLGIDAVSLADTVASSEPEKTHVPAETSAPPAGATAPAEELATSRQKAFLTYLGVPFTSDLTKSKAALLVNEAMESPKHSARIKKWDQERLRLYPDLFAEELKTQKENRVQHLLEACLTDGAEYFDGVTKAHAQVLVGYLDTHHPNWDGNEDRAQYFFAAVSEKFPQLVKKSARGKLKYPDGPKVARELAANAPAPKRTKRSPLFAAVRGVFLGIFTLAALYGAKEFYEENRPEVNSFLGEWIPSLAEPAPVHTSASISSVPSKATPPAEPGESDAAKPASAEPEPEPVAQSAPDPVPASPSPPPAEAPAGTMTAAADPAAPPAPGADTGAPTPIPLFEPTPSVIPGLDAIVPPAPATPAPRTSLTITRPTEVPLRFGTSTLPVGTSVSIVSVEGSSVLVRFGPEIVRVPVGNTDLNSSER